MNVSNYNATANTSNSIEEGDEKTGLFTPAINIDDVTKVLDGQKESTSTRRVHTILLTLSVMCVLLLLALNGKASYISRDYDADNGVEMSLEYESYGNYYNPHPTCNEIFGSELGTMYCSGQYLPGRDYCYEKDGGALCSYPLPCLPGSDWQMTRGRSANDCGPLCTNFEENDINVCPN